jgi:hypothetical protein
MIARDLLGLVESGYFERRPQQEEQATIRWLTRAIAELDKLRIVPEPTEVLDRLESLLGELNKLPVSQGDSSRAGTSQLKVVK